MFRDQPQSCSKLRIFEEIASLGHCRSKCMFAFLIGTRPGEPKLPYLRNDVGNWESVIG
jgi:hypothetical protein